jgi:hypothetical protein
MAGPAPHPPARAGVVRGGELSSWSGCPTAR